MLKAINAPVIMAVLSPDGSRTHNYSARWKDMLGGRMSIAVPLSMECAAEGEGEGPLHCSVGHEY